MEAPEGQTLLGQPTRARLFSTLRELRRAATTEELATALGMHANGVRRHLERMHRGGLLERSRHRYGRGRPRDEWSIAPGASPDGGPPRGYADVARWLARAAPTGPAGLRRIERTGREIGRDLVDGPVDEVPEAFRRAFAALKAVGLHHKMHAYPLQLSGGEQQRVAIARALINEPMLLLADEPTGNLDPDMASEIMALFQDVNARGTTVLVATHDRDMIQRMGKRVITLDHGRV